LSIIIDFAEELKVNWFMMYDFVPTGRGRDIIEAGLTPEQRETLLRLLWQKIKTKKVNVLSTAPQFAKVAQEVKAKFSKCANSHMTEEGCDEMVVPMHFYNPNLSGNFKTLADFIGGRGAGRFLHFTGA